MVVASSACGVALPCPGPAAAGVRAALLPQEGVRLRNTRCYKRAGVISLTLP